MSRLTLSDRAEHDLEHIYREGVRLFGERQADRYIDALFETLDVLCEFPSAGRLRVELNPAARSYAHRSHVIIYDVDENGHVLVVRIRHGHEDWLALTGSNP